MSTQMSRHKKGGHDGAETCKMEVKNCRNSKTLHKIFNNTSDRYLSAKTHPKLPGTKETASGSKLPWNSSSGLTQTRLISVVSVFASTLWQTVGTAPHTGGFHFFSHHNLINPSHLGWLNMDTGRIITVHNSSKLTCCTFSAPLFYVFMHKEKVLKEPSRILQFIHKFIYFYFYSFKWRCLEYEWHVWTDVPAETCLLDLILMSHFTWNITPRLSPNKIKH